MRFVTFEHAGTARVGICEGEHAVDLSEAAPDLPRDLVGLIRAGTSAFATAAQAVRTARPGARHALDRLRLLPPIPNPGKILCIGLNYRKHAEETGSPIPTYPVVFCRYNNTLVPHNGKMPRPSHSDQLDWEAELTVVIGKKCRNVPKDKALSVIAGYACFNDGLSLIHI